MLCQIVDINLSEMCGQMNSVSLLSSCISNNCARLWIVMGGQQKVQVQQDNLYKNVYNYVSVLLSLELVRGRYIQRPVSVTSVH